jgi:hypothetical protein
MASCSARVVSLPKEALMRFHRSNPACRLVALVTAATFLASTVDLVILARPALADAREELTRAEDYFLVADFATALQKVETLLDSGELSGGTLRDAWVLKARCEVGLAHRSTAVDAFCQALRVEPTWRPDPDLYTKDEMEVFEQARGSCAGGAPAQPTGEQPREPSRPLGERQPEATGGKPWYKKPAFLLVGGAVLVGGAIALAAGGGGDDGESDLPNFPDPPQ